MIKPVKTTNRNRNNRKTAKAPAKSKRTVSGGKVAMRANAKAPIQKRQKPANAQQVKNKTVVKESRKKKTNMSVPQPEEVKAALDKLLYNEIAVEYLKKNVSKMAVDVIGMLITPKTDEYLAEQLGTKINAIRRILNIMQGYGITNYYISKNTKGWLSFAWYINTNKLPPFLEYIEGMEKEKSIVNDTCNDYFICESCYKSDRFVFTFDSAFENSFKCNNCGKSLDRMSKEEAEQLLNKPSKAN
ncbi:MAG: hypothetical protein ACREBH_03070 [Candidatus Micrarchaeaceae archaeon]